MYKFIESSLTLLKLMSLQNINESNDKTQVLHATITDRFSLLNTLLLSTEKVDLKNEMNFFITNRIILITKSIVDYVMKGLINAKLVSENQCVNFKYNGTEYYNDKIMSLRDLQKLSLDIDHIILTTIDESTVNSMSHDKNYEFVNNLGNILVFLYQVFNKAINTNTDNSYLYSNIEKDFNSRQYIVLASHLLIKIAKTINDLSGYNYPPVDVGGENGHIDINTKVKLQFDTIVPMGSMTFINTLCLFNNFEYASIIIENKDGSSTLAVRESLINLLYIQNTLNSNFILNIRRLENA